MQLRILFVIHLYYPQHGAGAESMVRNISSYMIRQGHQVHILLMEAKHYNVEMIYDWEGAMVIPADSGRDLRDPIEWADVVFTHLTWTNWCIQVCSVLRRPVFFMSHNTHPYDMVKCRPEVRVIYNSNAMRDVLKYPNPSFVLHPPVDYRKLDKNTHPGEYITLVNLTANKGAKLFIELARAMPERKFIGVVGSYDPQYKESLPNITYFENSPAMERIYKMTRILLCPSKYESWGMCAVEAMSNGIPIIYQPTFGLRENVGEYGIPIPDKNPDGNELTIVGGEFGGIDHIANLAAWKKAIKSLDDPKIYKKYSTLSRKRSRELDPEKEFAELEKFIINETGNS